MHTRTQYTNTVFWTMLRRRKREKQQRRNKVLRPFSLLFRSTPTSVHPVKGSYVKGGGKKKKKTAKRGCTPHSYKTPRQISLTTSQRHKHLRRSQQ
jgi:hypothetical protein